MRRLYRSGLGTLLALFAGFAAMSVSPGKAESPLLVDLSSHVVEIDSSFAGTSLLLFGVTDEPGEIVVAIRGPEEPVVVRRKRRSVGVWLNSDSVAFRNVPAYYAVASSGPLGEIASKETLDHYQIGVEHLLLEAIWIRTEDDADGFRSAVRDQRIEAQLYPPRPNEVRFIDKRLFRATIDVPANVPTGEYATVIHLLRDGEVIATKETALRVEKGGMAADVFDFARDEGALYGLIAIFGALMAGWIGSVAFRKT
jgi:uncharacterized protein (TIGR02186 family)